MAEENQPVEVSENVLPAPLAAALRYLIVISGALPILLTIFGTRDIVAAIAYFQSAPGQQFVAAVISLFTLVYGLFRTYRTKKTLVAAAKAAPNSQFITVKK